MTTKNQRVVLMADDDEEDCTLAKEAFAESGSDAVFFFLDDGAKLMNYLSEQSRSEPAGLPDLILLDLNMPRKDGREALLEIRSDPVLQDIPIVVLTTSEEERDIEFSMKTGADSFITKPVTFNEWVEKMKSLAKCWLEG
jgi:CheY-like chemotaxis protein